MRLGRWCAHVGWQERKERGIRWAGAIRELDMLAFSSSRFDLNIDAREPNEHRSSDG
jgi:hypothetical protein